MGQFLILAALLLLEGSLTLHLRGNVGGGFVSVWRMDGVGSSNGERLPASAQRRLADLSARTGPDGARLIVRESDDVTPGEIGTYIVNRRGMPLATQIVLHR